MSKITRDDILESPQILTSRAVNHFVQLCEQREAEFSELVEAVGEFLTTGCTSRRLRDAYNVIAPPAPTSPADRLDKITDEAKKGGVISLDEIRAIAAELREGEG